MEWQAARVKKLEANHTHLVTKNNFRVLIFQVGQRSEQHHEKILQENNSCC